MPASKGFEVYGVKDDPIDFDLYTEEVSDRHYEGHVVDAIRRSIARDTQRLRADRKGSQEN